MVEVVEFFKVFSKDRLEQRFFEQIVDIKVPGGSFHDLHPDPGSAASSAVSRDEAFQWVFHTFLRSKKVRRRP